MKKFIALCITLMFILALSACGDNTAQGANNHNGAIAVYKIQDNPASYIGAITLIGIVGDSGTQDFSLQNEAGTFEIHVDYRGSQALPHLGETVSVEGRLTENRPCCGPGFTLTSTRFEVVSN